MSLNIENKPQFNAAASKIGSKAASIGKNTEASNPHSPAELRKKSQDNHAAIVRLLDQNQRNILKILETFKKLD